MLFRSREIRFGLGGGMLYVLVETSEVTATLLRSRELDVRVGPAQRYRFAVENGDLAVRREARNGDGWAAVPSEAKAAAGDVLEVGIPLAEVPAPPGSRLELRVLLRRGETELERHPEVAPLKIPLEEMTR